MCGGRDLGNVIETAVMSVEERVGLVESRSVCLCCVVLCCVFAVWCSRINCMTAEGRDVGNVMETAFMSVEVRVGLVES